MKGKEVSKRNEGITLIALVITIIVLLILAGVTIATLTGDNGLLTKAGNTKNTANEAEIEEKLKLAYQDYYLGQHTEKGYTFQNAVDKMFGTGVATVTEANDVYKVTFTNGKIYDYNISTGKVGEHIYVDPFNYGTKTRQTVDIGNKISLDTEEFMVIAKPNGKLMLMPYYNIELKTNNPKQSDSAENTAFSTEAYWTGVTDDINMSDSKNNIQKYIEAYKQTLEELGAESIEVRAIRESEINAVEYQYRNPGAKGSFWNSSNHYDDHNYVSNTDMYGNVNGSAFYDVFEKGVRPIIIIK